MTYEKEAPGDDNEFVHFEEEEELGGDPEEIIEEEGEEELVISERPGVAAAPQSVPARKPAGKKAAAKPGKKSAKKKPQPKKKAKAAPQKGKKKQPGKRVPSAARALTIGFPLETGNFVVRRLICPAAVRMSSRFDHQLTATFTQG